MWEKGAAMEEDEWREGQAKKGGGEAERGDVGGFCLLHQQLNEEPLNWKSFSL
jgi:hypothetical protein